MRERERDRERKREPGGGVLQTPARSKPVGAVAGPTTLGRPAKRPPMRPRAHPPSPPHPVDLNVARNIMIKKVASNWNQSCACASSNISARICGYTCRCESFHDLSPRLARLFIFSIRSASAWTTPFRRTLTRRTCRLSTSTVLTRSRPRGASRQVVFIARRTCPGHQGHAQDGAYTVWRGYLAMRVLKEVCRRPKGRTAIAHFADRRRRHRRRRLRGRRPVIGATVAGAGRTAGSLWPFAGLWPDALSAAPVFAWGASQARTPTGAAGDS